MFRPNVSRWLGKLFAPPSDRSRLRTMLGMTPLEDRTVPAAIPVTGPSGGTWVKVDTLTVSTRANQNVSTGVTSNVVLDAGVTYLAVASGTARIATDATGFADAEFIRYNKSTGPQDGSSPGYAWNNHGVRLAGLDGGTTSGNLWGTYQSDHQYVKTFTGQGTKVTGYYSDIPGYYGDNSGTLTVDLYAEVPTSADLQVTIDDGTSTYTPGDVHTYTVTVTNAGPEAVTGATILDAFAPTFTSVSWTATATGGATGFSTSGTSDIADIVSMPVGSTITYTVAGQTSSAATAALVNAAVVSVPAGTSDLDPTNNTAVDINEVTLTGTGAIGGNVFQDWGASGDGNGLRDSGEDGLAGETVSLIDHFGMVFQTTTDSNGDYSFTGLMAGTYSVKFDLPYGYDFTLQDQGSDPTLDSNVDPLTGTAITVTLTTSTSTSMTIGAGFILDAEVAPPPHLFNPLRVTTNLDVLDANDGLTSLREAVNYANGKMIGQQRITFADNVIGQTFILDVRLELHTHIFIDGLGKNITVTRNTVVDSQNQLFWVRDGAGSITTIVGLTLKNGGGGANLTGGAIRSDGNLTLQDCLIEDSSAGNGGGVAAMAGTLDIVNSTIRSNKALLGGALTTGSGGGIYLGALVTVVNITNSVISGNSGDQGGGVYMTSGLSGDPAAVNTVLTLNKSVVRSNSVFDNGGGIFVRSGGTVRPGQIKVIGGTAIVANTAGVMNSRGGGVYLGAGTLNYDDAFFAFNSALTGDGVFVGADAETVTGAGGVQFVFDSEEGD